MKFKTIETKSPWIPFLALLIASFFVIEAMAFQVTVLPVLIKDFGIAIALAGLISLSYYLSHTVFGPFFGNIGDQVGRKKIVILGFVIFSISEFMAAFSPNFTIYLAARFLQGVGAACIIPAAISYATTLFPSEKRGMALGVYAGISAAGAAAGGILGGVLVGNFGWQSVYIFTGTASLLSIFLVMLFLPETEKKEKKPFDFFGSFLLLLGVASILTVTMLITQLGLTSFYTLGVLSVGIVLITIFVFYERKVQNPFIDLDFFKQRPFVVPLAIVVLMGICFQAIMYSNAFFITNKPGGGSELTGFVTMCVYLASTLGGFVGGKLIDSFRIKPVILSSVLIFIVGIFMFQQFNVNTPIWYITLTIGLMAFTVSIKSAACIKLAMTVVPPHKLGQGSGTFVMIRDLGMPAGQTTGLSVFGAISAASLANALSGRAKGAGVEETFMPAILQAGASKGSSIEPALLEHLNQLGIKFMDLFNSATLDGMITALNRMSIIVLIVSIGLVLLALVLPNPPKEASAKKVQKKIDVELEEVLDQ